MRFLSRRLPHAADGGRFYAIELELFYPGVFFIPDGSVLLKHDSVERHINRAYLRFLAQIVSLIG